jgi:predicted dehydrogenase
MLGIGIIGGGRIAGAHARAALALPETTLAGIAEIDTGRRGQLAVQYDCPLFADAEALLAHPGVDAVVVALPHWLHCEAALAAFAAGKHVLLEKPMAMTVEECNRMIAAGQAAGRSLMVGHHHHFVPVNQETRRRIKAGEIGNLVLVTDTWYKPFYGHERPPWFLDASKGGGMWPMNGPHMIDRMTFFADSDIVAVKAKVGSPFYGLSATDLGVAFLEFRNGVCATVMHTGYRAGVERFEAELSGTEGQLRLSGRQLWRARDGQWEEIPSAVPRVETRFPVNPQAIAFLLEVREFAQAVAEGRPPAVSGEYGREIVRVLSACETSSAAGREVRLDAPA